MSPLLAIVYYFVQFLMFAILIRSLMSWFPIDRKGIVFQILDGITEPILIPLRKVVPLIGMLDITPMVAILVLYVISIALVRA